MAYTHIPTESKKKINKAGNFLAKFNNITSVGHEEMTEYFIAQDLANRWRACHAYPINTFQATLRTKLKGYKGDPLVLKDLRGCQLLLTS